MLAVQTMIDGAVIGTCNIPDDMWHLVRTHIKHVTDSLNGSLMPATIVEFVVVDTRDYSIVLHEQYRFNEPHPVCSVRLDASPGGPDTPRHPLEENLMRHHR